MKSLLAHALFLVLVMAAAAATPPRRVLFIGNSYTHFHDLPHLVREIAKVNGAELQTTAHSPGGATFQKQWEKGKALDLIRQGGWDAVVLQNQSYEPVCDPQNMLLYAEKLATEVRQANPKARLILFNTWAYRDMKAIDGPGSKFPPETRPQSTAEMQQRLNTAYAATAEKIHAEIAPVGQAWTLALQSDPKLKLHGGDHSHPTASGSFLAATVIHAQLFGTVAASLPAEIATVDKAGLPNAKPVQIQITESQRAAFISHAAAAIAALR